MINAPSGPSDLGEWSAPVVRDVLERAYAEALGDQPTVAKALAQSHARMWRHLLSGETELARARRNDLVAFATAHHVHRHTVGGADRAVIVEMVECVMTRYQGSPASACRYTLIMMEAAACLGETREAA
jgi:hypothetical protein